ncbi:GHMP family kinase ATP-binding protein [Conexibacter woesei]|uniref:4-diphosphocytidyl-2-C-methyl-D-erythritol kinase n=1 Tax=Conexibacter woesei (strain DSM 14684 / CCUG 47730 / CIP 108061 / JCM 11494 / NBRC 100937 / ID131577) TaxID=469383 RepID=D3FEH0_CONWI|nr:4-(cytidine 5'-diphospho)-2-C-methyl-D-erythritol kinase [Conexibacter woesei]ADB53662.1 4-(cytidine 5'-diphospho)-2-C-methyl-D- erythritol kinase [Conexibacter woesei DSM 14684]
MSGGTTLRALAPGKTNLCLFIGPTRGDGLHELVSLIEPLSLADELTLAPLPASARGGGDAPAADEVLCPGVDGPNLAATALSRYRDASGWDGPPRRLTIVKRVPVAAGMGGGSGDAAAALRLAAHAAGRPGDPLIAQLAPGLGADVPSQVEPAAVLVGGAGEHVERVTPPAAHGVLVLPSVERLSTPDVFREADRLGGGRDAADLLELRERVREGLLPELIVNDLEAAARSLCPAIEPALAAARAAGADQAIVSGSGPTVVGLYWGEDGERRAAAAAEQLRERFPGATAARPVAPDFASVVVVRDNEVSS